MECITPFFKKDDIKQLYMALPCGKCPNCLSRRTAAWAFRLKQEDKNAITSDFITLTYDDQHVPINDDGELVLDKKAIPLFFKRYRQEHVREINKYNKNAKKHDQPLITNRPIKYFGVGEYGDNSERPHYHILCFNSDIKHLEKAWPYGGVDVRKVSEALIAYALKYMCKESKLQENDKRPKEFHLMSKGLGLNYLTPQTIQYHKADPENRSYLRDVGNVKISMPRYYKDRIFNDDEKESISKKMAQLSAKTQAELEAAHGANYEKWRIENYEYKKRSKTNKRIQSKF
jgi:hypothetical protein